MKHFLSVHSKMKKIICYLLACIMLCSFTACAKNDINSLEVQERLQAMKEAEKVDNVKKLIDEIGDIWSYNLVNTKMKIEAAEKAYNELDDSLKPEVSNYSEIAKAWKLYEYYHYYNMAENTAHSSIMRKLKDPSSFKCITSFTTLYYDAELKAPLLISVSVEYSATNSYGGRVKDYYFVYYEIEDGKFSSSKYGYSDCDDRVEELGAIRISNTDILLKDF